VPRDVVLLPSLGRPGSDFADLGRRLEARGYVARPLDPPLTVPDGTDLHDVASLVVSRLDEEGVGAFHLIGHAFGNRLARMVTSDFPDRVASLTLLAAGGEVPAPHDIMESLLASFDDSLSPGDHLHHVGRAFFAPGNDPAVWASGWNAQVARWQGTALQATPREDWWDAVAPHVLVIQGLDDAIAPPENGRHYADDHRDVARLVEIPNAGHAMVVEQAALVSRSVLSFLLDVDHEGSRADEG
jgi:pimeloyl-ACP methyl ester carboxylesterase